MSKATRSRTLSGVSTGPREPLIAAQPVMPGLIRWRWAYSATRRADSTSPVFMFGACGRGPTRDISPRSTLKICGSSSRLVLRMKRPTRVTRQSSVHTCWAPASSRSSWRMERNFQTTISSLLNPWRRWRNRTGPGLSSFTAKATMAISGVARIRAARPTSTSCARLAKARSRSLWRPDMWASGMSARRERVESPRRVLDPQVDEQGDLVGQDAQLLDQGAHAALGAGADGDHHPVDIGHDPVADQGGGVAQEGHAAQVAGRAAVAVIEHAQHGHIGAAPGRGPTECAAVLGRADHDDIGDQPAGAAASA